MESMAFLLRGFGEARGKCMENLFGLTLQEIEARCHELQIPAYRSKQIADWIYHKSANSFEEMKNLPKELRSILASRFSIFKAVCIMQWDSADDVTSKFLLQFEDGVAVETVLMRQPYGNSVCISTQAGCAMGCTFCASTLHGVTRNLTAGEMLAEIFWINDYLRPKKQKVDTMVLMGSGEPMMNYDNVLGFLRLMHEKYCLNFSYRNVAISTSGVVPGIKRLEKENLPITLSISLHAANDSLRSELMPINKKYSIHDVVAAGKSYSETTRRRVTYEYILIHGVNDTEKDACDLANLLRGQMANVNLIPINPVRERHWKRPSKERVGDFLKYLEKLHISATIRREMGTDIQAACGQLRNQYEDGAEREFFD